MHFEEKLVTCPYNHAHRVIPSRLAGHLVKCKKQHGCEVQMRICDFNQNHHVPAQSYARHIQECPDRKIVEGAKMLANADPKPEFLAASAAPGADEDEDWETEMGAAVPYDPTKKCQEKGVLRYLQGATKSERRKFREKEKARLSQLEEQSAGGSSSSFATNRNNTSRGLREPKLNLDDTASSLRFNSSLNDAAQEGCFSAVGRGLAQKKAIVPTSGRGRAELRKRQH